MNNKGFTLAELLATIVILGIVVGIALVFTGDIFKDTKAKTEGVFVDTLEDALDMYLDSSHAKGLTFTALRKNGADVTINKTTGKSKVYKATTTFNSVITYGYSSLTANDLVNPANKDSKDSSHPYKCQSNGTLNIYRDEEYVYYYKINKAAFKCLNESGYISNLPSGIDE